MDTQIKPKRKGNTARFNDNRSKIISVLEKNPGITRIKLLEKLGWNHADYFRRVLRKHLENKKGKKFERWGLVVQGKVFIEKEKGKRDRIFLTTDYEKYKKERLKSCEALGKIVEDLLRFGKEYGSVPSDATPLYFSDKIIMLVPEMFESGIAFIPKIYPFNAVRVKVDSNIV